MKREYIINACSGTCIRAFAGQTITVIDLEGGQVVDFFCGTFEKSGGIFIHRSYDRL